MREALPDRQLSLTEPDTRAMKGCGGNVVAYNIQTAVEPEHHLSVARVVINNAGDCIQLTCMSKRARTAMQTEELIAVADHGYFNGEETLAHEQAAARGVVAITCPAAGTTWVASKPGGLNISE